MKRFFFSTLITIVSITIVIILLLSLVLAYRYNQAEGQWKEQAYQDYLTYIREQLTPEALLQFESSFTNIKLNLESFPNDRISGLFFRSYGPQMSFGIGKTPRGISITAQDVDIFDQTGETTETATTTTITDTLFDMTFNGVSLNLEETVSSMPIDFELPANVQDHDIAGSVTFSLNGTAFGTVYVLTHTPRTYSYSGTILNGSIKVLLWSIPFALLISLVMAWVFSYRNTKLVGGIQSTLKQLTEPEHEELKLPENSSPFIEQIFNSIKELDQTLIENQRNRSEWLRTISHDLNTPVASLKITLEGIQDHVFSPDDPQILKILSDETRTLEKRIHSITEFSRLQVLKEPEREEIPADIFASEVLTFLSEEDRRRVEVNIEAETITGDRELLEKACFELLKNAIEAASRLPAEEQKPITFTIRKAAEKAQICITNPGILPEGIDFFQPWARGDWSRQEGGSGMGLPIVARIMHLHKGTAQIAPVEGPAVTATLTW